MFGEIFKGIAQRVRLENSLQLQRAQLVRPREIKIEIAKKYREIQVELVADPELRTIYDSINLVVPGAEEAKPAPAAE